jgi:hypothetical protein
MVTGPHRSASHCGCLMPPRPSSSSVSRQVRRRRDTGLEVSRNLQARVTGGRHVGGQHARLHAPHRRCSVERAAAGVGGGAHPRQRRFGRQRAVSSVNKERAVAPVLLQRRSKRFYTSSARSNSTWIMRGGSTGRSRPAFALHSFRSACTTNCSRRIKRHCVEFNLHAGGSNRRSCVANGGVCGGLFGGGVLLRFTFGDFFDAEGAPAFCGEFSGDLPLSGELASLRSSFIATPSAGAQPLSCSSCR